MGKIDDLLRRANRDNTNEEWFRLQEEMVQFMKEDHPIEEKRLLLPLGALEQVNMMCKAIKRDHMCNKQG